MGAHSFDDLLHHVGHKIVCVTYEAKAGFGSVDKGDIWNVAVECEDCNTVLMDYNWDENCDIGEYNLNEPASYVTTSNEKEKGEEGDDELPTD